MHSMNNLYRCYLRCFFSKNIGKLMTDRKLHAFGKALKELPQALVEGDGALRCLIVLLVIFWRFGRGPLQVVPPVKECHGPTPCAVYYNKRKRQSCGSGWVWEWYGETNVPSLNHGLKKYRHCVTTEDLKCDSVTGKYEGEHDSTSVVIFCCYVNAWRSIP